MQGNDNFITITSHRFVNGIVQNFPYKMVQTILTSTTDIHTRSFANRSKPFQDSNLGSIVSFNRLFFFL